MRPTRSTTIIVAALLATACADDGTGPDSVPSAVRVEPDSVGLVPGDAIVLTAVVVDESGAPIESLNSFAWSSSDTAVVTVDDDGTVTAVAVGPTLVTATVQGLSGTADVAAAWLSLKSLDVGGRHSCGLTDLGALYCWGSSTNGQIGDGLREHRAAPVRHTTGAYASIGLGNWHTCGLADDGTAYCFGSNSDGQVTGEGIDVLERRIVAGAPPLAAIYGGGLHACGLTAEGRAYCWGDNTDGALGNDESSFGESSAVAVVGDLSFTSLALGAMHTCGLTADGTAYCWGYNALGQLGIGSTGGTHFAPEPVAGGLTFVGIFAGNHNTCGLQEGGELYCWGEDNHGQVGDGESSTTCTVGDFQHECAIVPTEVAGAIAFETVTIGSVFACGVSTAGDAYCWGHNGFGQLGIGVAEDGVHAAPEPVSGDLTFAVVEAGLHHACGITTDGLAYCWGRNEHGEVGDGTPSDFLAEPTLVRRQTPGP